MFAIRQPHHFSVSPLAAPGACRGRSFRRRASPTTIADLLHQSLRPHHQPKRQRRELPQAIRVDISETDQAIVVDADVPGFAKHELAVDLDGRVLTITAERKAIVDASEAPATTQRGADEAVATNQADGVSPAADTDANAETAGADASAEAASQQHTEEGAQEAKQGDEEPSRRPAALVTHLIRERRPARLVTRASRSFRLPAAVDADRAQASFEDGVLHLTLPKAQTRHHIAIE